MDPSLSDISRMIYEMSPEEQREALAALRLSALSAMAARGEAPPVPEPEEYTPEEAERLFGNQSKLATAYFRKPLNIRGITLLSHSQFMAYRDRIPPAEKSWWLLDSIPDDKGNYRHYYVNMDGQSVAASAGDTINRGVRPVLILSEDSEADVGSFFNIDNIPFRMITDRLALCDRTLFAAMYRKHYLSSTIKKGLQEWLEENSREKDATIVHFGRYKWHPSGDSEPIEWLVLKQEDGKMLLISKYVLDYRIFDIKLQSYENSEIRTWLSGDFFSEAFSNEEKNQILSGMLPESALKEDKVFLLSSQEALKMLNKEDRLGIYTPYVRKMRHLTVAGPGHWWCRDGHVTSESFRSGRIEVNRPNFVGKDGRVFNHFCYVETKGWNSSTKKYEPLPEPIYPSSNPKGVRPALWIRTD